MQAFLYEHRADLIGGLFALACLLVSFDFAMRRHTPSAQIVHHGKPEVSQTPSSEKILEALKIIAPHGFLKEIGEGARVPFTLVRAQDGHPWFWAGTNGAGAWLLRENSDRKSVAKVLVGNHSKSYAPYILIKDLVEARPELAPYFCPFELLPESLPIDLGNQTAGIRSSVCRFDVILMNYMRSPTINSFIKAHKDSVKGRERLRTFAGNFRRMAAVLHQEGVVHGDYNCGNIMVSDDCQPVLIDLDSFGYRGYEAALQMQGRGEFQPPGRFDHDDWFTSCPTHIDYFSEWVIYASLIAYCEDREAKVETDQLYFSYIDFRPDMKRGGREPLSLNGGFERLSPLSNPILNRLVEAMQMVCLNQLHPQDMQPLEYLCPAPLYEAWENNGGLSMAASSFAASETN